MKFFIPIPFLLLLLASGKPSDEHLIKWKEVDKGLHYAELISPVNSSIGDSKISLLKISPQYYSFDLISAKEKNEPNKTAKNWGIDRNLIACVNAGMYQMDMKTNVGMMRDFDFENNSEMNDDNTVVAFNRIDESVPEFQIIDLQCQKWADLEWKYNSFTQGIRMIDCHQKNVWAQKPKMWSMTIIATDKSGNALFIFTRSPYSVHDFINILLKLDIDIYNAMYLEGGPEASFYLNYNGTEIERFGSYETGFNEFDTNPRAWQIPNVIGVRKK